MSTSSKAQYSEIEDIICQGDIYKNVRYSYIESEDDDGVNVVEYEFPLAVIISQACDTISMEQIVNKGTGKPTKFMPSILMCPIYDKNSVKSGLHIEEAFMVYQYEFIKEDTFQKDDYKVAERDWHYRYHALQVKVDDEIVIDKALVDFKHYFTIPMSYLVKHKNERVLHLDDIFAEQLTLKFSTFLSRVAIPD